MPSALTTVVPNVLLPSLIVTVALGLPVPLSVGVLSLVLDPATIVPTSVPTLSTTLTILTDCWRVSKVNWVSCDSPLVLPAASVIVVLIACAPSTKAVLGLKHHLPSAPTKAVPSARPLS